MHIFENSVSKDVLDKIFKIEEMYANAKIIVHYSALAACGFVYARNPNDVRNTYSIELSGDTIIDLEEKPTHPVSNIMGTGNCVFKNVFFEYIRDYCWARNNKLLFSFPDVLKMAITRGETVIAREIGKLYLNFNYEVDIKNNFKNHLN